MDRPPNLERSAVGGAGLPEISECRVTREADGTLLLTHKGSGQTAAAEESAEDLMIQSAILRCLATYPWLRHPRQET